MCESQQGLEICDVNSGKGFYITLTHVVALLRMTAALNVLLVLLLACFDMM